MYYSEDIKFNSKEETLVGTLYKPNNVNTYPVIVVLHAANLGERESHFYNHLIEILTSNSIGVFIYDRRGSGESSGDFNIASFEDLAIDALSAISMLKKMNGIETVGLYGISQGGWVATLAASLSNEVSFLIIVSTPAVSPSEQMLYASSISLKEAGFSIEVIEEVTTLKKMVDEYFRDKSERSFVQSLLQKNVNEDWYTHAYLPPKGLLPENKKSSKWYYELDYNPINCFETIKVPILFIFGEKDIYVPVNLSLELFRNTVPIKDVTFLTYNKVDHFMNFIDSKNRNSSISKEYKHDLMNWLSQVVLNKSR